jgi:hypothetical protein
LGGFCRFAANSLSTFLLTPSGPAQASGNLLCPSFFVETTSGDAHVGEKIFGRTVESFWRVQEPSAFRIWRFVRVRCESVPGQVAVKACGSASERPPIKGCNGVAVDRFGQACRFLAPCFLPPSVCSTWLFGRTKQ